MIGAAVALAAAIMTAVAPAPGDAFLGDDFPVPITLDLAGDVVAALRNISEHYASRLAEACPEAAEAASRTEVACECARGPNHPPSVPPRTLNLHPVTLTVAARTPEEGKMALLECRPVVCFCPNGKREALLPPPLPDLEWVPDKFFVDRLTERLWDVYFGPVGLSQWPRPFLRQLPPAAPPMMMMMGDMAMMEEEQQQVQEQVEEVQVPAEMVEAVEARAKEEVMKEVGLDDFPQLAQLLKKFKRQVEARSMELDAVCPGDAAEDVECECKPYTIPQGDQAGSLNQLTLTLDELKTGKMLFVCQPEVCYCADGGDNANTNHTFTGTSGCDDDDAVDPAFAVRFRDWLAAVVDGGHACDDNEPTTTAGDKGAEEAAVSAVPADMVSEAAAMEETEMAASMEEEEAGEEEEGG